VIFGVAVVFPLVITFGVDVPAPRAGTLLVYFNNPLSIKQWKVVTGFIAAIAKLYCSNVTDKQTPLTFPSTTTITEQ